MFRGNNWLILSEETLNRIVQKAIDTNIIDSKGTVTDIAQRKELGQKTFWIRLQHAPHDETFLYENSEEHPGYCTTCGERQGRHTVEAGELRCESP